MTFIKFEPIKELENLSTRFQKYFEDFPNFGVEFGGAFTPRIDISEDEKFLYVDAELAGTGKDDIKITLHDNILTLKGEKKKGDEKKNRNYFRTERAFGAFSRSFTLPVQVDSNNIEARFEDGVLKIQMEKMSPKPVNEKEIRLS